jgi:hypothetical protein
MIFAVSDAVWLAIIGLINIVVTWYLNNNTTKSLEDATIKRCEIYKSTEAKLDSLKVNRS